MFNKELQQKINQDFPGLNAQIDGSPVTYLDSAATSLKPQQMIDAVNEYYSGISSNVHRGKNYSLELVSNRYETARYRVAELISASGNEIVFLRNTTEATNLIASGLKLSKEDTVLICSDSHHSNMLPWMKHATTKVVATDAQGNLDIDNYLTLLHHNPKVVAITHCSNVTGVYNPVKMMIEEAHKVGAIVVLDAAQSVPHRRVNVLDLDVDFMTFSAHKMLGPTGIGVLYGKKDLLDTLEPSLYGGGMVDWVDEESFRLRKLPHRLEAGTPHISGAYGFGAAIDYLHEIGLDNIESHDKHFGQLLLTEASKRDYMQVINPDASLDRGAVLSFKIPALKKLDDIARILSDSYGLMCRNGHLCAQPYIDKQADAQVLRVSTYIYNTEEDIQKFFSAMDEIGEFMI